MKRFLTILSMSLIVFSCTKDMSSPISDFQPPTAIDKAKAKPVPAPVAKSKTYTYNYVGDTGEGYAISFPAFNIALGTLKSWKVTVTRKVTGTDAITNTWGKRNDSAISVSRYLSVLMGDNPICTLPTGIVEQLKQTIGTNQSMKVPINTTVSDVINSTPTTLGYPLGDATGVITWTFNDLVEVFKPNCTNDFSLEDYVTVAVTYTYTVN